MQQEGRLFSQEEISHSLTTSLDCLAGQTGAERMGPPCSGPHPGQDYLVMHTSCPLFKPKPCVRTTPPRDGLRGVVTEPLCPFPEAVTWNKPPFLIGLLRTSTEASLLEARSDPGSFVH